MSKGTSLSLVRHSTHGSFAKVAIPEKIASAVTERTRMNISVVSNMVGTRRLTRVVARIRRLVWIADIVQRHLIFVVSVMTDAERPEGQQE